MSPTELAKAISGTSVIFPSLVTTRNGVEFDPRPNRWSYRDGGLDLNMNFSSIRSVTPEILSSLKYTLAWYAENMSPSHTQNMFNRAAHFLKRTPAENWPVARISAASLLNYRAKLTKRTQWYLTNLSGLFQQWHALGAPGVTSDAIHLLEQIRLPGNQKGESVATMDPVTGPLTDIERSAALTALHNAYASREIGIGEYVLVLLVSIFGRRPIQYSYLKCSDIYKRRGKNGATLYFLRIPRAKQRGETPRESFKERPLTTQIGELAFEYARVVASRYVGKLDDPLNAPLFPEEKPDQEYPDGLEFHCTANSIGRRVTNVCKLLQARSERTGEIMRLNALRWRRTFGTQAAREGHGEYVIAELLDHSDIQNVRVYVEFDPAIVERIDRAVALTMAPIAQAFEGIFSDKTTEPDDEPARRIVAPEQTGNFDAVGKCGTHGFCSFLAPIACYTCLHFRAWQDGPHEEVLEALLADRERLMRATDQRMAAINDRTIFAVAHVVELCKLAREGIYPEEALSDLEDEIDLEEDITE